MRAPRGRTVRHGAARRGSGCTTFKPTSPPPRACRAPAAPLPRPCRDPAANPALTLPHPCRDPAATLPQPCPHPATPLPRPCRDPPAAAATSRSLGSTRSTTSSTPCCSTTPCSPSSPAGPSGGQLLFFPVFSRTTQRRRCSTVRGRANENPGAPGALTRVNPWSNGRCLRLNHPPPPAPQVLRHPHRAHDQVALLRLPAHRDLGQVGGGRRHVYQLRQSFGALLGVPARPLQGRGAGRCPATQSRTPHPACRSAARSPMGSGVVCCPAAGSGRPTPRAPTPPLPKGSPSTPLASACASSTPTLTTRARRRAPRRQSCCSPSWQRSRRACPRPSAVRVWEGGARRPGRAGTRLDLACALGGALAAPPPCMRLGTPRNQQPPYETSTAKPRLTLRPAPPPRPNRNPKATSTPARAPPR